ncbi:phosphoribosyl pyrophosphate synthetase [Perkinsela sp. CCAP 1560/4]|nr:phosphoribosyl pyrophosphate synthetase [Perkinsela sp. CCAP 1560/4]|eukprot:KNH03805.1 phosphoribosyl pyrophosphate synthetase [Perkinsela sp. CCAP 1560/4]
MKAVQIVDGIPQDPVKLMGQYFRRAGSLFAGNLSTNPSELYKHLEERKNCHDKFGSHAKQYPTKKFKQLPTELKMFFIEKAEQNAKIKDVIGIENVFNSQCFYNFCHKVYGKNTKTKAICRLLYYVHLRRSFLRLLYEDSSIDVSEPRLAQYDKPVLPLIVEEMLQHSQSLQRSLSAFEASCLPLGLRRKASYVGMVKVLPEEMNTLHAVQSISRNARQIAGKITPHRSPSKLFHSYIEGIRRKGSPSILQFRNVIQAHAFFENYANYLNTIRYWRLKLLEKEMIG